MACLVKFSMLKDLLTALIKPWSLLLGVGGLVPYTGRLDCTGKRSDVALIKLGAKEEAVAVFGTVEEPVCGCEVSKRVMVRPDGILPDPLCFRRLEGPEKPVGEAGLDRFRGVRVADVFDERAEGTANGLCEEFMGK
jgi:hypothetical protein